MAVDPESEAARLRAEAEAEQQEVVTLSTLATRVEELFQQVLHSRWQFLGIAVVIALIFAIPIGLLGMAYSRQDDTITELERQRVELEKTVDRLEGVIAQQDAEQEARIVSSCFQRVEDRIAFNRALLDATGHDRNTGAPTERFLAAPPERQLNAVEFLQNLRPLPICSLDNIERYYASNGAEGVVPIDPADYGTAVIDPNR